MNNNNEYFKRFIYEGRWVIIMNIVSALFVNQPGDWAGSWQELTDVQLLPLSHVNGRKCFIHLQSCRRDFKCFEDGPSPPGEGKQANCGTWRNPPDSLPPNQNQHRNYIEGGN